MCLDAILLGTMCAASAFVISMTHHRQGEEPEKHFQSVAFLFSAAFLLTKPTVTSDRLTASRIRLMNLRRWCREKNDCRSNAREDNGRNNSVADNSQIILTFFQFASLSIFPT